MNYRRYLELVFCISVLMTVPKVSISQMRYEGKNFYLTLGGYNNNLNADIPKVILTSKHLASVDFFFTSLGQTSTYIVTPNVPLVVSISAAQHFAITGNLLETVENESLHISSDSNIVVSLVMTPFAADDAMFIPPADNQRYADSFRLLGYSKYSYNPNSDTVLGVFPYSIVSNCDNVELEITPLVDLTSHQANVPYTVIMNKGETYQLSAKEYATSRAECDISGTLIRVKNAQCCYPINVFANFPYWYVAFPIDSAKCCADNMMEQILPVNWWGTEYPVISYYRNEYSVLRIISSTNNNSVFYNGTIAKVLNAGEVFDTLVWAANPSVITSSNPIGIMELMTSTYVADTIGDNGDPDMLWVMSRNEGIKESIFSCKPNGFDTTYPGAQNYILNIIARTIDVNSIQLDGVFIASQFTAFLSNTGWSSAQILVDSNFVHHLVSPEKIIAYLQLQYWCGGYVYNLPDLAGDIFIDTLNSSVVMTDTVYRCIGVDTLIASSALSYIWNTGDTSRQIIVDSVGVYSVQEITKEDSCYFTRKMHFFYVLERLDDTVRRNDSLYKCLDEFTTLSGENADSYLWSTGDTTESLVVQNDGEYHVYAVRTDSCNHRTHYFLSWHIRNVLKDTLYIRDTILKCPDVPITISALSSLSYNWANGDTSETITVSDFGNFSVYETYLDTCLKVRQQTFSVLEKQFNIELKLGKDTTICIGDQLMLHTGYPSTVWSTGEIGPIIYINNDGTYTALVVDSCGNEYRDVIKIITDKCLDRYCRLNFPSVFSPNDDNKNDVFRAMFYGVLRSYKLEVYNRWGERVYETHDIKAGWDGVYKGEPMPVGTYYYLCYFTCPQAGSQILKGDVTLVR